MSSIDDHAVPVLRSHPCSRMKSSHPCSEDRPIHASDIAPALSASSYVAASVERRFPLAVLASLSCPALSPLAEEYGVPALGPVPASSPTPASKLSRAFLAVPVANAGLPGGGVGLAGGRLLVPGPGRDPRIHARGLSRMVGERADTRVIGCVADFW